MSSLVSVLAKEMDVWPDDQKYFTCDPTGEIRASLDIQYDFHPKENVNESERTAEFAGLGDDLPRVTREMWQAERDRQKGGEWKRHRGSKCPVADDVIVDVRFGDKDIVSGKRADFWEWRRDEADPRIRSYRIIRQPQAEEVEVRKFTQDLNIHTPQGEFIRGPISLNDEVIYPADPEWRTDQIDGPLAWRDTIIHCQAIIEDCEREIRENENKLALEGFALIPAMTPIMGVTDVDMGDWRNWKAGDKIRMTARDWDDLTKGSIYEIVDTGDDFITIIDDVDYRRPIEVDDETMFEHGRLIDFEFVSSP